MISLRKIFFIMLLVVSSLYAEVTNEYPTNALINSNIKIIDIRTPQEWKEDGILKGAIPITFFDQRGEYDIPLFMSELGKRIKKGEKFALICHTGSRTVIVSKFLSKNFNMNVINLLGGMEYARSAGLPIVPYKR